MLSYKLYKPFETAKLFDHIFSDFGAGSLGIESKVNEDGSASFAMDLPGVKQEDLSVEITDDVIYIKAERKTKTSSYAVNKNFSVPEKYDSSTLSASLEDGVLTLTVFPHKAQDKQTRKIPIVNKK
jgi:HSP20 family molecular chaperone IbpA